MLGLPPAQTSRGRLPARWLRPQLAAPVLGWPERIGNLKQGLLIEIERLVGECLVANEIGERRGVTSVGERDVFMEALVKAVGVMVRTGLEARGS